MQGEEVDIYEALKDDSWIRGEFITTVQRHSTAVTKCKKLHSAVSATQSSGVISNGNSYGVTDVSLYSLPITIKNKTGKMLKVSLIMIFHLRR